MIFPQEMVKYMRPQIFGQSADILTVVPVQQPVQYGRDAACSAQTQTRIGLLEVEEIPRSGVQIPCLS